MKTVSPLRYPGGKTCMLPLLVNILRENKLLLSDYAEPYAGGCGLALSLLYGGHVSDIHINDIDPGIWSFWHSVLNLNSAFIDKIKTTDVSMDEWYNQKDILRENDSSDPLRLGFATFFLNRTNRSGIIKNAGAIGGYQQNGNYKIDCRFNRDDLSRRISRIHKYKSRIHLSNLDAIDFLQQKDAFDESTFFCIDPPYFNKGSSLYTSFYNADDHGDVAKAISEINFPWIITYDKTDHIRVLYKQFRHYLFDINYSVQTKRVGTELLIASKGLRVPAEVRENQLAKYTKKAA